MVKYVKVKHKSNTILNKVKYCDTFLLRVKGLMFSRKPSKKEGLLLVSDKECKNSTTIHMFFVFFSLDIFWLDKELRVVDMAKNVHPFEPLIIPREKAKYVLEVPAGRISVDLVGEKLKLE